LTGLCAALERGVIGFDAAALAEEIARYIARDPGRQGEAHSIAAESAGSGDSGANGVRKL
jgi:hypothetical protein